jgi:hypothetical protein
VAGTLVIGTVSGDVIGTVSGNVIRSADLRRSASMSPFENEWTDLERRSSKSPIGSSRCPARRWHENYSLSGKGFAT